MTARRIITRCYCRKPALPGSIFCREHRDEERERQLASRDDRADLVERAAMATAAARHRGADVPPAPSTAPAERPAYGGDHP